MSNDGKSNNRHELLGEIQMQIHYVSKYSKNDQSNRYGMHMTKLEAESKNKEHPKIKSDFDFSKIIEGKVFKNITTNMIDKPILNTGKGAVKSVFSNVIQSP